MALFDPPSSSDPVSQGQPKAPLTSSPYAAMEHHELLQLIEDLNDERAQGRFREGIWMAIFAHLMLFLLLYFLPTFVFHSAKVIDPIDAMKDHAREIYLNPPDLPRSMQHRATPKPQPRVLNQQTLHQLQDLQRQSQAEEAARAAAQPQPQQQQAPPPPQQQEAKNNPLLPLPDSPMPQANSLPDMPMPQAQSPQQQAENNADAQFNRQIQSAAHNAIQGNSSRNYSSGSVGANSKGLGTGMQILSDTHGVDFSKYMEKLRYIIQTAWQPLIPESVYPPLLKQGVVGIRFTIAKDGKLDGITLTTPSGDVALDKAAWGAIVSPQPFPPLPKEYPEKDLIIQGGFFYNTNPE